MTPKDYDVTSLLSLFLTPSEPCVDCNDWDRREKAAYVRNSLRGDAAPILEDETDANASYDELVQHFENRNGTEGQVSSFRMQWKSRKRRKNDTLMSPYRDVPPLVNGIDDIKADAISNTLKEKCRNPVSIPLRTAVVRSIRCSKRFAEDLSDAIPLPVSRRYYEEHPPAPGARLVPDDTRMRITRNFEKDERRQCEEINKRISDVTRALEQSVPSITLHRAEDRIEVPTVRRNPESQGTPTVSANSYNDINHNVSSFRNADAVPRREGNRGPTCLRTPPTCWTCGVMGHTNRECDIPSARRRAVFLTPKVRDEVAPADASTQRDTKKTRRGRRGPKSYGASVSTSEDVADVTSAAIPLPTAPEPWIVRTVTPRVVSISASGVVLLAVLGDDEVALRTTFTTAPGVAPMTVSLNDVATAPSVTSQAERHGVPRRNPVFGAGDAVDIVEIKKTLRRK